MFGELVRQDEALSSQSCEQNFLQFVENTVVLKHQKTEIANENIRLNSELIKSNQEIRTLEEKLKVGF